MIAIRHTGIYVNDIITLEKFYTKVFNMTAICSMLPNKNNIFDELLGIKNVKIVTTKLITPCGKEKGQGDMLELVKVLSSSNFQNLPKNYSIATQGIAHVAFSVEDINYTVEMIKNMGGIQITSIATMENGNNLCFCRDPEHNWIELIQKNSKTN